MKRLLLLGFLAMGCRAEPEQANSQHYAEAYDQTANAIVGGTESDNADWPWIVSLQNDDGHYCAGALIDAEWVLTAAHCVTEEAGLTRVLIGPDPATAYVKTAESIIQHPEFDADTAWADIALIHVATAVPGTVKPVALNYDHGLPNEIHLDSASTSSYLNVRTAGWGKTSAPGSDSYPTLREASLPAISIDDCFDAYPATDRIISIANICAGFDAGGVSTCFGDSGGPLTFTYDGRKLLAGITSWGDNGLTCASAGKPAVFTRVSVFTSWIREHVNAKSQSPSASIMTSIWLP
jgi:secreted trypsin-like serine protease